MPELARNFSTIAAIKRDNYVGLLQTSDEIVPGRWAPQGNHFAFWKNDSEAQ